MPPPTISYLTGVHFASGAIGLLAEVLAELGVRRPLVVTDPGLRKLGITERIGMKDATVFSDVQTNPDEVSAVAGVQVFRENDCDGIVAVGGGSPIDCAKCISLLVSHPAPLEQYALIRGGLNRITNDKPPLVAIPTTAGTGTEVGRAALVTMDSGVKLAVISPHIIPTQAICDPELTLGLPPDLTAATGADAISHCVETYCSPKFNPVADSIALDGLHRATKHLAAAVRDGSDIEHRSEMMMAALQGGLTFQKGLGLIHSLSHPLGALTHHRLHHGALNAIYLPHVLRFNAEACPEKMRRMAQAVGTDENGEALAKAFEKLHAEIGLPVRLRDLGVTADDLQGIPQAAVEDHSTPTNPRQVDVANAKTVLQAGF
ncbi:MAG: iron-containing alcohol dehydrogenase [Planctomycetes bacterium]|nr:iron-containing alcohol dehydrogenase [Planctomycetota bacterium]